MNQCWNACFVRPCIYIAAIFRYIRTIVVPPPPFHRPLLFLIYTHIQLSLFVDHQHSTVAVDMCRALWTGCDGGRGGGPTRDTLHAGFCDNTFSDTCEIRVCPRSAVCNVMSHPCFSCNCSSLCILYVCNI
jgi:hypothetical protein